MKKYMFIISIAVIIAACGSNDTGNKKEADKKETINDLSQDPDYQKGLALVSKSENLCLTCHKIDEKLTGPAYRDVANKYESTASNVKMLAEKVIKGGTGVWGEAIMLPNSKVSQADAEAMVRYILLLKK